MDIFFFVVSLIGLTNNIEKRTLVIFNFVLVGDKISICLIFDIKM